MALARPPFRAGATWLPRRYLRGSPARPEGHDAHPSLPYFVPPPAEPDFSDQYTEHRISVPLITPLSPLSIAIGAVAARAVTYPLDRLALLRQLQTLPLQARVSNLDTLLVRQDSRPSRLRSYFSGECLIFPFDMLVAPDIVVAKGDNR